MIWLDSVLFKYIFYTQLAAKGPILCIPKNKYCTKFWRRVKKVCTVHIVCISSEWFTCYEEKEQITKLL
jgi:hypothetical protein